MVSRNRGLLAGAASAAILAVIGSGQMVTAQLVTAQAGERTISIHNIHTKETVTVVYKKGGKYVEAGLDKVNHVMRDHRRNEVTKMDPELVDLLWEVHHELGSKEPIHLISGFRSRASNEQLRKSVGGQASESRHILGKAADVHFPDVPVKNIRYSALVRERGGVGYYPTSATPFVHIDTDRIRSWPRLPRYELALLFPSGSTRHAAAEGGPITREDVQVAQVRYGDLSRQIASFHDGRKGANSAVAMANAGQHLNVTPAVDREPPLRPQLASLRPASTPNLAEELRIPPASPKLSPPMATAPSANDRARLAALADAASKSEGPRLVQGPMPARRPPQPALMASLSGGSLPLPGILQVAPPPTAPTKKIAAVSPAALPNAATSSFAPAAIDGARFGWSGAWSPAPAYDEEHPEELSYRPFPIAPFLTETAEEPLMSEFVSHDVARTVDLIDQDSAPLPLTFRPGKQVAHLMWSQQFTGHAVGISKLRQEPSVEGGNGVQSSSGADFAEAVADGMCSGAGR